jgi:PAS domain S-box-containing protein
MANASSSSESKSIAVLLVEDDPHQALLVQETLAGSLSPTSEERFVVTTVDRLAAAVEWLARDSIDLILLDLGLPDTRGLATLETLRARFPNVPVVVLTALNDQETAIAAVRAGAQDYLLKEDLRGGALARSLLLAVERFRAEDERHRRLREERAARSQSEAAARRAAFLADVSALLDASLDYEATLAQVPRLAVPMLADCCIVDLRGGDGLIRRVAWAHHLPAKEAILRELELRATVKPEEIPAIAQVLASGESSVVPDISEAALVSGARSATHLELLRRVGMRAAMSVPMRARGQVYGVMSFLLTEGERRFSSGDLTLAEELAARAALAVDNARLYQAAQTELAERQRSEASVRAFIEHSPLGILRVTPDGRFLDVNPAIVQMLGYDSAAALKQENEQSFYVDRSVRTALYDAFERGLFDPVETEWWRRDRGVIRVRLSCRPVRDHEGRIVHVEGFVIDVTPLHAAQEALRRAEKLATVGQVVSGVAHELNNPLSAILLSADNLLQEAHVPPDVDTLHIIKDQAKRARAIVRDLRSLVRNRESPREMVFVNQVVERLAKPLQARVEPLGARLEIAVGDEEVAVFADRAAIEQVLANLVVNGAQAAGSGGTVRLTLRRDAGDCLLIVEDSGPGIEADVMPRIFEPFFTTRPTGEGAGLGLPVSLGIIEHHGGALAAENRPAAEGGGARFTVRIPCPEATAVQSWAASRELPVPVPNGVVAAPTPPTAPPPLPTVAPQAAGAASAQPSGNGAGAAPRVLIIDDEMAIRTALRRFFTRRNWEVDEAENGKTALTALLGENGTSKPYVVIISDLKMPGLSGIELHDRLLAVRPDLLSRVIFSTGDTASHEAAAFLARTRCRVLQKPFELATLAELAENLRAADGSGTQTE